MFYREKPDTVNSFMNSSWTEIEPVNVVETSDLMDKAVTFTKLSDAVNNSINSSVSYIAREYLTLTDDLLTVTAYYNTKEIIVKTASEANIVVDTTNLWNYWRTIINTTPTETVNIKIIVGETELTTTLEGGSTYMLLYVDASWQVIKIDNITRQPIIVE
jgi:hypothetical protein